MKQTATILILCAITFLACNKVDDSDTGFGQMRFFTTVIVNPGDPSKSNSSIDLYSPLSDSIWYDAYNSVNKASLGLYISAGAQVKDEYWLLAPNNDKILILGAEDLKLKAQIYGVNSPQCIATIDNTVLVGSKNEKVMYSIDINSHAVTKVPMTYAKVNDIYVYDEQYEEYIYVACNDEQCHQIYIMNIDSNKITDSFSLIDGAPSQITTGEWGFVNVLCGSEEYGIPWSINQNKRLGGATTASYPLSQNYTYTKMVGLDEITEHSLFAPSSFYLLCRSSDLNQDNISNYTDQNKVAYSSTLVTGNDYPTKNLISFYPGPYTNIYITGSKEDGTPLAIRTGNLDMTDKISEIPIRDSLAFFLFKSN